MTGPRIYKAINAVIAEFSDDGIAKTHANAKEQYLYRSIDDVLNRLAPLLAKHRLCVLPRVLERIAVDRDGVGNEALVSVTLRVAFDLVSAVDQSRHTVEAFGEALDGGDKATSKAMSAAYKGAMLQTFCIPVAGNDEADAHTHNLARRTHVPPPVQGWEQWSQDIIEIIRSCESEDAIRRVQNSHRSLLKSLSRERADLYAAIGQAFSSQTNSLHSRSREPAVRRTGHFSKSGAVHESARLSPTESARA